MNDTSETFEKIYREKFSQLTGEERLKMCSDSFDAARAIVLASMHGSESIEDEKIFLLRRFYENDFSEKEFSDIVESIKHAK